MTEQYPYTNLSLDDMPNEIWKNVVGYEGIYMVSNMGRVKCLRIQDSQGRKQTPHIKKQSLMHVGYLCVRLSKNGVGKNKTVHSLVATAFLENNEQKGDVDHIDCNRKNNIVTNLRWCTRRENMLNPITYNRTCKSSKKRAASKEGMEHLNRISKLGHSPIFHEKRKKTISKNPNFASWSRIKVVQFDLNMNKIAEYDSIVSAQKATGATHISSCCIGKRKSSGGYIWKYKN